MKAAFTRTQEDLDVSNETTFTPNKSLHQSWQVFNCENPGWGWTLSVEIHKQELMWYCLIQTDYLDLDVSSVTKGNSAGEAVYTAFTNIGVYFDTPFKDDDFDLDEIVDIAIRAINEEMGTYNPVISTVFNY